MAYRPVYNGPARVTGGAGTGKTVVAVHRARFLAKQLVESGDSTSKILVATYTNSLADNLASSLRGFCSPEEYRRLDVSTVDSVAAQVLAAAKIAVCAQSDQTSYAIWRRMQPRWLEWTSTAWTGASFLAEWEGVILSRKLTSLADYAISPRPGRGTRLVRSIRGVVWSAVGYLTAELARRHQATYLQLADKQPTSSPRGRPSHMLMSSSTKPRICILPSGGC